MQNKILKIPTRRQRETKAFWIKIVTDINAGMTPDQIAERYINPKTHKPYTREHIYWVIRKINKGIIN